MAGDKRHESKISSSATVLEFKQQLAKELDIPVDSQRLIYSGKILKDGDTLETYKIKDGHALHLIKGASKKKQQSNSTPATNSGDASGSSSNTNTTGVPRNISAGQGAFDPLAGITGARYAGYNVPMPTMEQMGVNPDGMQIPDQHQLEQMMDNPMYQQSMRAMLSDPQMLDYMIQQSPQLRAMGPMARQMLQSEYFRNMLTNPQALHSMMDFQRMMNQTRGQSGNGQSNTGFPAPGASATATANNSNGDASTANANPSSSPSSSTPGANNNASANTGNSSATAAANPFAALFGANPANSSASGPGDNANPFANPYMQSMLAAMSANTQASQATTPPPHDNRPPEELYETQLRQLNDMGFFDFERNVRALRRSGGSVEGAVDELLNNSV